jgi:phosphoserine aminotransferase
MLLDTQPMASASPDPDKIQIPAELRPRDGRFGSGPSKVRPEALAALYGTAGAYLGTSHRQAPVRDVVGRLREGIRELFTLPAEYEVVLGVGGATALWDAMAASLIETRSEHLVFGEFSSKFAAAAGLAPHLSEPIVIESEPGTHPAAAPREDVDLYALTHNETSTGVQMPATRVVPAEAGLTVIDGVSAAGGLPVEPAQFDVYYFSPQKGFASDGGLWIALSSPAAVDRIERLAAAGGENRWLPPSLSLKTALENSRKNQTYNTPPLASLFLAAEQVAWINSNGGLPWSVARCSRSAEILYGWADAHKYAEPFVRDPESRSRVVGTIDFSDDIDAAELASVLRRNGIVDTEPYRKLGRNQLRIAMYPAIEPEDVSLLTKSIDHVIELLHG